MKHMGGLSDITPGRSVRGGNGAIARIWHIVISPKGSIPQNPDLGWGLPLRLGHKASAQALRTEAALGAGELRKDPEIREASVEIELIEGATYRVRIVGTTTDAAAFEIEQELQAA